MAGKTVLVLGGGVGGLVTANELRSRLGREHLIVLADRDGKHVFWPSLLWLQVGLRKSDNIVRDLASLENRGIEVIKGQVNDIDPDKKIIGVDGREIAADYFVVSLGAELAPELVPGLAEAGHNLYSLEGATAKRDARVGFSEGSLVVLVAKTPFKARPPLIKRLCCWTTTSGNERYATRSRCRFTHRSEDPWA